MEDVNIEFNNWKEALELLLKTEHKNEVVLNTSNYKRNVVFLKEACMKYNAKFGNQSIFFKYDYDLTSFTYKFGSDNRSELTGYIPELAKNIKNIQFGEILEITEETCKIAVVRMIVSKYTTGYSVKKTETGCIVRCKGVADTFKNKVGIAIGNLREVPSSIEIDGTFEMINSARIYVSQLKEKGTKYNTQFFDGKIRIIRIK